MEGIVRSRVTRQLLLRRLSALEDVRSTQYRLPGEVQRFDTTTPDTEIVENLAAVVAGSDTGSVLIDAADVLTLVLPPFAVESRGDANGLDVQPLIELLERRRVVAAFLLRLGGFSVGVFRGDVLVDSKTDQRFVKNRHRKGGQSQRRFERIREKQIDELFDKACETAQGTLAPYESEIQHVFVGGDRHTLQQFRKACRYFDRYGDRLMSRVLPVAGDPRKRSLEAAPREIWSSDVYVFTRTNPVASDAPS